MTGGLFINRSINSCTDRRLSISRKSGHRSHRKKNRYKDSNKSLLHNSKEKRRRVERSPPHQDHALLRNSLKSRPMRRPKTGTAITNIASTSCCMILLRTVPALEKKFVMNVPTSVKTDAIVAVTAVPGVSTSFSGNLRYLWTREVDSNYRTVSNDQPVPSRFRFTVPNPASP